MGHHQKKKPTDKLSSKERLKQKRKEAKKLRQQRKARLVVRNLPFSATEKNLKEFYEKYGEVTEVKLLRKPDGKLVGCGFIQFKEVQKAAKARHYTSGQPFLGRNIECDFALPKDKFSDRNKKGAKNSKNQPVSEIKIKEEPSVEDEENPKVDEVTEITLNDIKIEKEKENDEETHIQNDNICSCNDEEQNCGKREERDSSNNIKKEDEEENEDVRKDNDALIEEIEDDEEDEKEGIEESSSEQQDIKHENNMKSRTKDRSLEEDYEDSSSENYSSEEFEPSSQKPRKISNDISEGKTVFIKNVPFSATNEDLKQCMLQFGPVYYALICIDKFTEHSKGTAFVKFINKDDAEKCLQAGTELKLFENILDCYPALKKNEITQKNSDKQKGSKDSRNLYLVKEGVVLAGSKAAEGVSASDMAKRLQLEQHKTQMLRKLNMFVSRTRLIIHNLPLSFDDAKLRALFKKHSLPKATIKEARIMRDMKNVDSKGVGKSKEFGFVSFTDHEHALAALRSLNNNPNIFSPNKRPIVAFSIENKVMVNAKEKRLLNSKLKNPKSKDYNPEISKRKEEGKKREEEITNQSGKKRKIDAKEPDFAGVAATPGAKKMRSRYNLTTQAKIHHEHLKEKKKKEKLAKKSLKERRKDFIRQDKQKKNEKKVKEDDNFSKLVSFYKNNLVNSRVDKKTKWYEGD